MCTEGSGGVPGVVLVEITVMRLLDYCEEGAAFTGWI